MGGFPAHLLYVAGFLVLTMTLGALLILLCLRLSRFDRGVLGTGLVAK